MQSTVGKASAEEDTLQLLATPTEHKQAHPQICQLDPDTDLNTAPANWLSDDRLPNMAGFTLKSTAASAATRGGDKEPFSR